MREQNFTLSLQQEQSAVCSLRLNFWENVLLGIGLRCRRNFGDYPPRQSFSPSLAVASEHATAWEAWREVRREIGQPAALSREKER